MRFHDIILVTYLELVINSTKDLYKYYYRLVSSIVVNRNNKYKVEKVL